VILAVVATLLIHPIYDDSLGCCVKIVLKETAIFKQPLTQASSTITIF
jgi:hypothetical protein